MIAGMLSIRAERPFSDPRGDFSRIFEWSDPARLGLVGEVRQINLSRTRRRGTVRGMHMQDAPDQGFKVVRCLAGKVWDVCLDLRTGSPTYMAWEAVELSADNPRSAWIAPGCAHGFQTLSDDVELLYLQGEDYNPALERRIHPLDPSVGIAWPLQVGGLSESDSNSPFLPAGPTGSPT